MRTLLRKARTASILVRQHLRGIYWRMILTELGPGSVIFGPITVVEPRCLTIGTRGRINAGASFYGRKGCKIVLEDNVTVSTRASLIATGLDIHSGQRRHTQADITVRSGAWIGAHAVILGGVTIGERAVVAAGAVVTRDVPAHSVVKGVPAR